LPICCSASFDLRRRRAAVQIKTADFGMSLDDEFA
jgi:hypothetical protein